MAASSTPMLSMPLQFGIQGQVRKSALNSTVEVRVLIFRLQDLVLYAGRADALNIIHGLKVMGITSLPTSQRS